MRSSLLVELMLLSLSIPAVSGLSTTTPRSRHTARPSFIRTSRRRLSTPPRQVQPRKKHQLTNQQPFEELVTTITSKSKTVLYFRKQPSHPKNNTQSHSWRLGIQASIDTHPEIGTLPGDLLRKIPPVMTSWARTRSLQGTQQTLQLLTRYVEECKHVTGPNNQTIPETRLFNIAMDAWTKSGRPEAPQEILKLFKKMQALRSRWPNLQPDVISLSSLCLAWAKSRRPDAAQQAKEILEHMIQKGYKPNTKTYNAVLLAFVHSSDKEKAQHVETLIQQMQERFDSGHIDCRPDVCSYQCLMTALSRTPNLSPTRVEEILNQLRQNHLVEPNAHCYVAAIHAWGYSRELNKSRRAYELLLQLRKEYRKSGQKPSLKPNVVAYTAVINACAMTMETDALAIAQLVMEEMRYDSFDKPTFMTYAAFLHVLGSSVPFSDQRRHLLAQQIMEQAINDGQVGCIVLEKLYTASASVYKEMVEIDREGVAHIPPEWSRNVVGERQNT